MENLDAQLFYWLNHLPDAFHGSVFLYIHYVSFLWIFLLTLVLWFRYKNKRGILIKGFLITVLTYGIGMGLKFLIDRPRPAQVLEDVLVRADYSFPSFPSNQVAAFFAFATLLALLFYAIASHKATVTIQ